MASMPYNEKRQSGLPDFKTNPEYERLFSKLSDDAYNQLKESIRINGQFVPITVSQNYEVLDGHHRLKACREQGIVPKFEMKKFATKEEEKAFVIRINLHRRHMKPFERIEKAYMLEGIERAKARSRQLAHLRRGNEIPLAQNDADGQNGKVMDKCAQEADVSPNTYRKGRYIILHGTSDQKWSLHNDQASIEKIYNELRLVEEDKEEKPPFQGQVVQVSKTVKLVYGDFRTITDKEIARNSIKLIIPGEYVDNNKKEIYGYFARFAEWTLQPGGFMVLSVNQSEMWEVRDIVEKETTELKVFWPFIAKLPAIGGVSIYVDSKLQLFLLFVKGEPPRLNGRFIDFKDFSIDPTPNYTYADKIIEHLITSLSLENDVVCDPSAGYSLAGGVGTKLKRHYVGIEIDWEKFRTAKYLF